MFVSGEASSAAVCCHLPTRMLLEAAACVACGAVCMHCAVCVLLVHMGAAV
jgi:hypothetical protein